MGLSGDSWEPRFGNKNQIRRKNGNSIKLFKFSFSTCAIKERFHRKLELLINFSSFAQIEA
jgi:hypothetical protein